MAKIYEKRRYQERAVEAFKDWSAIPVEKERLATVLLPTGTGKTFVVSQFFEWLYANGSNEKLLWGAHRRELIYQAYETLKLLIPNKKIEIEMGDLRASADADIVVGSVQTFARNRKNIVGFDPKYIVVDEWHHFHEDNTQYNGLLEKFPNAKVIGPTATPYRWIGGDLPLGRKLIEMDIGTAIRHNYLVPITAEVLKTNVSLADVHKKNGDFNITELSKTVNTDERNLLIVDRIVKAIKEESRKGIIFAADVHHAHTLYELLKDKVVAAEIYGTTDDDERAKTIEKVRNGEIDILLNFGIATEGFDSPCLNMVCVARPTMSLGLYTQMVGRVLRLFAGKIDALVIDVFDKIKITQSRITYAHLAKFGGIIDDGSKRIDAILKEPIANALKNFPIMMRLEDQDRLTIDNETWFTPSWIVGENQWVISWTKSEERILIEKEYELKPLLYVPNEWNLRKNHMQVHHRFFGAGEAYDIHGAFMKINFEDGIGIKSIDFTEISKREPKYEKKKLDKPIKRVFYICIKKNGGRLISMLQENKNDYKIIEDIRGDKTTINEFISATATDDDMMQIVKTEAKWREKPASAKQREYVGRLIQQKKTTDDIDLNNFSAGDASVVIDQAMWHGAINNLFGAINQKELIGYNSMYDDV